MRTELSKIAQDLEQGAISEKEARSLLLGLLGVGSSTIIKPISFELSESTKAHIEMMERAHENFHKYAAKALMIPKEYFGSK